MMSIRTKLALTFVFFLGMVTSVASIVRIGYLWQYSQPLTTFFKHDNGLALLSIMEPGVGIIAACVMTLRPLYNLFHSRMRKQEKDLSVSDDNVDDASL